MQKLQFAYLNCNLNVDSEILHYATKNRKFAVATLDSDLLKRLRMADVTTITLSKNKMIIANRYFEG